MRHIAEATGVAQSTVSRVLNNVASPVSIAPETRKRVLAAAERLGYRPNPLARALRGAPTMLLGAIVRDVTDPFFGRAIDALSIAAAARGYNVVLGNAHGRADEALALAAVLETRHTDAVIILGDMQDQPRLLQELQSVPTPAVALWQGSQMRGIPSVNVDNREGIRLAMDHLFELGHRRIAFVGGPRLGDITERRDAFTEYMAEAGAEVPGGYLRPGVSSYSAGAEALQALLALPDRPTAVVAATDAIAVGVLHEADATGLKVPDDLSVTGFDDLPLAAFAVPALTTVRMPIDRMIEDAVQIAIGDAAMSPEERSSIVQLVRPTLVVRQSTSAPPAAA